MAIISSISGFRATLDSLTSAIVIDYANALNSFLPKQRKIIICRDGRTSGVWIEKMLQNVFTSLGRNVEILGVVPTPTLQVAIEESRAAGGIAITASHNPSEWNGMKFMNHKGIFLDEKENNALWNLLNKSVKKSQMSDFGSVKYNNSSIDFHIRKILSIPFIKNIIPNIQNRKFNIVVDAVNSAGSFAIPKLLQALGCDVIALHCDGTGSFPHIPEPLPENLTELAESVKKYDADLGIAVDPDADRLVIIDENGNAIGEEKTICIAIESVFELLKNINFSRNIVVNQSTTRLVDYLAEKYYASLYRSPVGEINVVKKMQEVGAIIGGEGSGGVILPECHYGRDSLVGCALLLALLTTTNKKLSQIVDAYPTYKMVKTKQIFSGKFISIQNALQKKFADQKISTIDGIRIDFDDAWVHIRSSNTEPVIRIIAEADTEAKANLLIANISSVMENIAEL